MSDIDVTRRNKRPRQLTEPEKEKLDEYTEQIHYSARYAQHPFHLDTHEPCKRRSTPPTTRRSKDKDGMA